MKPLWEPTARRVGQTNLTRFMREIEREHGIALPDYGALYDWSTANIEAFWWAVWKFGGIIGTPGGRILANGRSMPGAAWFPDGTLNFAENLLRHRGDGTAIVFSGEERIHGKVTFDELRAEVSRFAQALRASGIRPGDRVAGYLPNLPGTIIAMLAATSVGAVWSSCSPDFGVQGVLDRFGQIGPRVLVTCDGYFYGGKAIDVLERLPDIRAGLPSVEKVVVIPYTTAWPDISRIPDAVDVHDFMAPHTPGEIEFEPLPFNHPLYIMYSSGTTGVPKCIVHGAGGTLLQHLKEHQLHADVKPADRLFYFTTCGWMMWNWLVSGLASGATVMLYDGSPFVARGNVLWNFASREKISIFGTSAKYIDAIAKLGLEPGRTHELSSLKAILSTGSPLSPESFEYVYRNIGKDIQLASISGGTDIISCFALGNPNGPVWRGELQCRGLGMKVEVYDDTGTPVTGVKGELVCSLPFPSMPVGFWNDPDGSRYRAAYFEKYPGVWCHGDYVELTPRDGLIIYGRSDAVLNPGGVRIGTAEIYRQVEQIEEVVESLAIGQDWDNDVRVVLFVRLREGLELDDALRERIKTRIRENTTARHVPACILQVPDIPRTKSGKIVELAVRNVVHGLPVKNVEALANPEALTAFANRPELAR